MSWQQPVEGCESPQSAPKLKRKREQDAVDSWQHPPAGAEEATDEGVDDIPAWLALGDGHSPESEPNEEPSQQPREYVCSLDLGMVLLATAQQGEDAAAATAYSRRGSCPKRVRSVLAAGCKCKSRCMQSMNLNALVAFCQHFHQLSSENQSVLLNMAYYEGASFTMQQPSSSSSTGTADEDDWDAMLDVSEEHVRRWTRWQLLGEPVSANCLVAMLGMSKASLYKKIHQEPDKRKVRPAGTRPRPQSMLVEQFFYETYWEAAEVLPELPMHLEKVDDVIRMGEAFPSTTSVPVLPEWTPECSAADVLTNAMVSDKLPTRFIQHGSLSDLWWRFVSWHSALQGLGRNESTIRPCLTTFWNVWNTRWRKVLRFRKSSQHSQCGLCFKYSQLLHKGKLDATSKKAAAAEWMKHLSGTYMDRLLYWHLRFTSRCRSHGVVVIIIDAMDRAKFHWPQYAFTRPKTLDSFVRPKLAVTAAHAHGFCAEIHVSHDETETHGASHFIEVLLRLLGRIQCICQERQWPFPTQLVLQSDNTCSQAKNGEVCLFLSTHLIAMNFQGLQAMSCFSLR